VLQLLFTRRISNQRKGKEEKERKKKKGKEDRGPVLATSRFALTAPPRGGEEKKRKKKGYHRGKWPPVDAMCTATLKTKAETPEDGKERGKKRGKKKRKGGGEGRDARVWSGLTGPIKERKRGADRLSLQGQCRGAER